MENTENGFARFNLSAPLMFTLNNIGFAIPTEIQEKVIPMILEGRDILGSAQTGSGKTAAFALPLIEMLSKDLDSSVLVVTPTRELAEQVFKVMFRLTKGIRGMYSVSLIGGQSMYTQIHQLKQKRPNIVVGTPGRINDHLKRGTLSLDNAKYLVLDETDRMLDMGFGVQVDEILKNFPENRQTLMFSATFSKKIIKLADTYLSNPQHITAGEMNTVAECITQESKFVQNKERFDELTKVLIEKEGAFLIFARTQRNVEALEEKLKEQRIDSLSIHGGYSQSKRDNVIRMFRNKKSRILIATDLAARGLDITHIENVVNYDLPMNPEDYIHRIGRTGRANAPGYALSLVTPETKRLWSNISYFLSGDESKIEAIPLKGEKKKSRNLKTKRFAAGKSERVAKRKEKRLQDSFASEALSDVVKRPDFSSKPQRYRKEKASEAYSSERMPKAAGTFSSEKRSRTSDEFSSDKRSKFSSERMSKAADTFSSEKRSRTSDEFSSDKRSKFSSERMSKAADTFSSEKRSRTSDEFSSDRRSKYSSERMPKAADTFSSEKRSKFSSERRSKPAEGFSSDRLPMAAKPQTLKKENKRSYEQSKSKYKQRGEKRPMLDTPFCMNGLLDECYAQKISKKSAPRKKDLKKAARKRQDND